VPQALVEHGSSIENRFASDACLVSELSASCVLFQILLRFWEQVHGITRPLRSLQNDDGFVTELTLYAFNVDVIFPWGMWFQPMSNGCDESFQYGGQACRWQKSCSGCQNNAFQVSTQASMKWPNYSVSALSAANSSVTQVYCITLTYSGDYSGDRLNIRR
jgi:hypothetical protein